MEKENDGSLSWTFFSKYCKFRDLSFFAHAKQIVDTDAYFVTDHCSTFSSIAVLLFLLCCDSFGLLILFI